MKKRKRRLPGIGFIILFGLILFLVFSNIFGITSRYGDVVTPVIKSASEIRFGIDIRGGVDVSFVPSGEGVEATEEQLDAAQAVIEQRLVSLAINDYELYKDYDRSRLILRFPWQVGETEFNPETAIEELATSAVLTFREGSEQDENTGAPTGTTAEKIILEGNDVVSAKVQYGNVRGSAAIGGEQSEYFIALELSEEGRKKFSQATEDIVNSTEVDTMSIWMDNEMISAPRVEQKIDSDPIITGGGYDGGNGFDPAEAKSLADKINAGSLPFALQAESYSTISPTLGSQSLRAMVIAGIMAFIMVALFMMLNYRLPGFVASISLLGQVFGTLALVSGYFVVFQGLTTLTLPGIAGIILGIGMGVDANVITGERIKEELRSGKKLDAAIKAGFQRGVAPIIDSNMTVLIVAVMLMGAFGPPDSVLATLLKPLFFAFGTTTAGNIYSFGVTLAISVFLNLIFGVLANRAMLTSLSKIRALRKPTWYGALKEGKEAPAAPHANIVGKRKRAFTLSALLIVAIVVVSLVFGVQLDVQFRGGVILTYSYYGEVDTGEVQQVVNETLGGNATAQTGTSATTGAGTLTITMAGAETLETNQVQQMTDALNNRFGDKGFEQLELSNINPTIGKQFLAKCVVALIAASILILIYIAIRFRKIGGWMGGLTAVVALLHDLIIIFGVFAVLRIPLSGNFIAALLTILGYSINDTVVVYDRVRENRSLYGKKKSFAELVNLSINQSLRRSVNTTVTTLIALGCVAIFSVVYGLDSIFTFVFPLMIGMVSGVYSSICIAGPLWVMLASKKGEDTKLALATADGPGKTAAPDDEDDEDELDDGEELDDEDWDEEEDNEDEEPAEEEDVKAAAGRKNAKKNTSTKKADAEKDGQKAKPASSKASSAKKAVKDDVDETPEKPAKKAGTGKAAPASGTAKRPARKATGSRKATAKPEPKGSMEPTVKKTVAKAEDEGSAKPAAKKVVAKPTGKAGGASNTKKASPAPKTAADGNDTKPKSSKGKKPANTDGKEEKAND